MRNTLIATIVSVAALTAAPKAFFHFELLRSTPANKAVLQAAPTRLQLWFSQVPAAGVSVLTLAKGKESIALGKTTIEAKDKSMSAEPVKPLAPGTYVLHWKGAGDDGHVQNGDIAFMIAAK